MRIVSFYIAFFSSCLAVTVFAPTASAVVPSEQLLPAGTKGFVSIPNLELLETQFNETQLGQLMADPIMKGFSQDFKRQLRAKWKKAHSPLGITWDDMRNVPSGEIGMARILLSKDKVSTVIIADVSEKMDAAKKLLADVEANMAKLKAKKDTVRIGDFDVTTYTHTQGPDEGATVAYFIHPEHHQMVVADDLEATRNIIPRFAEPGTDSLAGVKSYQITKQRVATAQGDLTPHLQWFVDPFGFVEAQRASNQDSAADKKTDVYEILKNQGFTAIQGIGGLVTFSHGDRDIEHRTMIYAPPPYKLAMRMIKLFDRPNHQPPNWIPRELASFVSVNADLRNGFEHSETLVDEYAGDKGVFDDIIDSLKNDPAGPKVDIRAELVDHLAEHVMVLTDYQLPLTLESERVLACIELTKVAPVVAAIDKIMKNDPNAKRTTINGHRVWQVLPEEAGEDDFEFEFEFEGDELDVDIPDAAEEKKDLPASIITVAHGHLIVGTHLDLLRRVLTQIDKRRTLAASIDYQIVQEEMQKLGATQDSCQYFSRTDEEYRATYELIKQGRMPEGKTVLARLLNALYDDDDDDETLREQQIDGSKLPPYQAVRRYLGPAGLFVISEEDGWMATGCLLRTN
ncbi:MAG: hypothetical protein VX988_03170 [Planctomycetota bacterium]|nr:hypothetical protein [Planctomycetota bacterium]